MTNIDIDYIVPMVFPDDPKWRHDLLTATGTYRDDRSAVTNVRYRSWNTEPILIDLIRKNLPWLRTIHIILARPSQLQPWMKPLLPAAVPEASASGSPAVRIVYHADIMPPEVLPTFNSRAIEMYLHNIPGLAPCFLYGNDDMFPLAPLPVTDFFRPAPVPEASASGPIPCLHYTEHPFNPARPFQVACMNGLNFVATTVAEASASRTSHFPRRFTDHWLRIGHNVVPILKSTCEHFWHHYPRQMAASVTPFRLPKNFNQYIYSWHQILSGQYIDHRAPRTYLSINTPADAIRNAIRTADGLLCINDNNSVNDITNIAAIVRSEISHRL